MKLEVWLGVGGLVIALLALLYGDNWLGEQAEPSNQHVPASVAAPEPEAQPLPADLPRQRPTAHITIPVVIRDLGEPEIRPTKVQSPARPDTEQELKKLYEKMSRDNVAFNATLACKSVGYKQSGQISAFIFSASIAQNQFYNTNNSRAMISDLEAWLPKVRKYLEENKANLPDVSVFELANATGDFGIIKREGAKAWATMDVKRKALEAINREISARPCEKIGKAALAECEEAGTCLNGRSNAMPQ